MDKLKEKLVENRRWVLYLGIPLLTLLLHGPIIPKELSGIHAWRQSETMANVLNYYQEDFYLFSPRVHSQIWEDGYKRMEFPIMQWGFAWFYYAFGEHIWIIRLLTFLIGLVSVFGMYHLALHLFGKPWYGLLAAWTFSFSPVFFYYTVNPLPDNMALMWGIWGLALFMRWLRHGKRLDIGLMGFCLCMATLCKLPFLLFWGLPGGYALVDLIQSRGKNWRKAAFLVLPGLVLLTPAAVWYLRVIPTWRGNGIVAGIFDATAEDLPLIAKIFVKNLISMLPELFLNYGSVPFFGFGVWYFVRERFYRRPLGLAFLALAAAASAYYLFEINMITTVHDYYMFPFLPGLILLVVVGASKMLAHPSVWGKRFTYFALAVLPVLAVARSYPRWDKHPPAEEFFTYREEIRNAVPPGTKVLAGGDLSPHIYLYHINRWGWTIHQDVVWLGQVDEFMAQGATHLFSDNRELEAHPAVQPHLGEQLNAWGNMRLWKLK